MSGFAVFIETNAASQAGDGAFQSFLQLTADYKKLDLPAEQASGRHCHAAKLDSPSSLHKGITRDEKTGSWLLAAGTVVDITGGGRSDPSLRALLRDYLENGQDALQRYDGQFALVIYDKRDDSLSVISDPVGCFSIFYGTRGNQTFISTSALAVARQIRTKPDPLAVDCFLRTGVVFGSTTLWRGVKRLMPATVIRFTDGQVQESEYWAPTVDETIASLSFADALAQAVETLSHTFELALRREGKIWADLTGGFDTRLATTIMSKANIPFVTYCVGPAGEPDVTISTEISKEIGWEYRHMSMPDDWAREQCAWFETALHKGDAHLNVVQLSGVLWGHQERSITSNVSVTGMGGELWRGAYWRQELFNIGRTTTVNYDRFIDFKVFLSSIPESVLREDRKDQVHQELKKQLEKVTARYADLPNTTQLDRIIVYTYTNHEGAYLSAAAGIQRYLHPFCFKAPTTFAFSLNDKWRHPVYERFVRALLEKENPRIANILTTHGGPAVPMRVTNVHKFWPFWKSVINRVAGKFSRQLLGKPIMIWPESDYPEYPLPAWKQGWLSFAAEEGLLQPSEMRSGDFYNAQELQRLVSQAESENLYDEFLNRIITVEMAMRTVETDMDSVL